VNLLLLEPGELDGASACTLRGRRALHLQRVLRVVPGQRVRAGLLGGALGDAEVVAIAGDAVELRCAFDRPAPPSSGDVLLLAVPRPVVLLRLLEQAAALGYSRIVLFRSWRVDKSHLQSEAMDPVVQRRHLLLGLEQSMRTRLPEVRAFELFRPFVDDELDGMDLPPARFCAHPGAPVPARGAAIAANAPFALALGPERGFLPYEVDRLGDHGFAAISLGPHPLRTETALGVLHGQLDLLRQRG
jgi:RsmE family RNA methyltransferase